MPLKRGYSKSVISDNIVREIRKGYPPKQAIAMSFESARRSALKNLDIPAFMELQPRIGYSKGKYSWFILEHREGPIGGPYRFIKWIGPFWDSEEKTRSKEFNTQFSLQRNKLDHVVIKSWRYTPGTGWERDWEKYI